jgi:hypothetical protein
VDPLLAAGALISGIMVASSLRRIFRLRFLRRLYKYDFTIPELNDYLPTGIQDLLPFHPLRSSTLIFLKGFQNLIMWKMQLQRIFFFGFFGGIL